jgi:hypothetical protein
VSRGGLQLGLCGPGSKEVEEGSGERGCELNPVCSRVTPSYRVLHIDPADACSGMGSMQWEACSGKHAMGSM